MSASQEWIGVADVAAELRLTDREAWELVKRIGCPVLEGSGRGPRPPASSAPTSRRRGCGAWGPRRAGSPTPGGRPTRRRPRRPPTGPTDVGTSASKRAKIRAL